MDVDGDVCYPPQSDDIWKRDDVEGLVILDPPDRGSPLGGRTLDNSDMAGPARMDVSYPHGSEGIWKRDQIRSLMMADTDYGFPLDAEKRSNRKRLGDSGSGTCPKAESNEPEAAEVAICLPFGEGPPRSCDICFKDHLHYNPRCPYWDIVPRGAPVGSGYQVMCQGCGSDFIIAKWVCSFCGGKGGKVSPKACLICNAYLQHTSEECPVDLVAAGEYKQIRERRLRSYTQAGALVPTKPRYVPPPDGFADTEEVQC